jgi:hypothetical protein
VSGNAAEPLGLALRRQGSALHFSLLSRGDRVGGWLQPCAEAGARPLILVLGPQGRADEPLTEAARAAWSGWAGIASLDLPLCGRRRSDKLGVAALAGAGPLAEAVCADLEQQARSDLTRALGALVRLECVAPERVALVAAGTSAQRALGFAQAAALAAIALCGHERRALPAPAEPARWYVAPAGADPASDAWLGEAGGFLRERLRLG